MPWRDVLRCLASDDARSQAIDLYRADGYTPDDFEHRLAARRAMVDALVRTEDALELRGVRVERAEVRAVRRRLELEVWP